MTTLAQPKSKRVYPRTGRVSSKMARDRRASYVKGIVEEAMRAFIGAGVSPSTATVAAVVPEVPYELVRWARTSLIDGGVVQVQKGLLTNSTELARAAIRATGARIREALERKASDGPGVLPTPEALGTRRIAVIDLSQPPPPPGPRRDRHAYHAVVKAALARERKILAFGAELRARLAREREEASVGNS